MSRLGCAGAGITPAAGHPTASTESPVTSYYAYKPLDSSAHDIRILRFTDPPEDGQDPVHCTLCHVSLDDLLPAYREFKSEFQFSSQKDLANRWCQSYFWDRGWLAHETSPTVISTSRFLAESQALHDLSGSHADENDNMPIPHRFSWGDFEALSYCWGSDIRDRVIYVDGLPLPVPTNFEEMVKQVRNLPEARSGMGFWADSVCINQTDLYEKQSQIGLMKRIYTEASSTVIWLGPNYQNSDNAVTALNDCFGNSRPDWERCGTPGQDWQSLLDLWSRDYFTRMWIIQELALNKSLSLSLCGDRQFTRHALQDACYWVREHSGDIAQALVDGVGGNGTNLSPDHVWSIAANVLRLITLSVSEEDVDILYDLAHKSRVKEPHDKVYGLLGLLPDWLATKIVPDYAKPVEVIYEEFATLLQHNCWRLDEVLSWSTVDAQTESPYWVPNWMKPHERNHIKWFRKFDAGGSEAIGQVLSQDGKTLICEGVYVDSIEQAGVPSSENLPYRIINPPSPELLWLHTADSPSKDLKAVVRRTLLHGHPMEQAGASLLDLRWVDWSKLEDPSVRDHMLDKIHSSSHHWHSFDSFRQTNADFLVCGRKLKDFFPSMKGNELEDPFEPPKQDFDPFPIICIQSGEDHDQAHNQSENENQQPEAMVPVHVKYAKKHKDHLWNLRITAVALRKRRLFTTHNGLLGLAPDEIQKGDAVAILKGCNYPVVLRNHENGYKYVGECYVDDWMHRDVFRGDNRGVYALRTFVIL